MKALKISLAVAAAAAVAVTAACGSSANSGGPTNGSTGSANPSAEGGSKPVAEIGVFLPLTGENAENGKQIKDAVEMYVDDYNKGDHKVTVKLTVRDDRGEPKTATNIAREFAQDKDTLAVLGSFTSTASMAAAPILSEAGIPQISPTSSHPDFTKIGKCVFRGTPTQNLEATSIAEYVVKELKKTSAAIIYRQDDWGNSASKAFKEGFEDSGGKITASEAVAPDSRDFRTLVTSLQGSGVDTVYLALQYSDAAVLAQQMKASGWAPTVVTATSLYTHQLVELGGKGAVEGWDVPAFFYAESTNPLVKKFVDEFSSRYSEKPDAFGAVGYDAMGVLGTALDATGTVGADGRQALCDAMFKVDIPGVTGEMKFDQNGDVKKTITWLKIHDGEFVEQ